MLCLYEVNVDSLGQDSQSHDEKVLFERIAQGDKVAFETIFHIYWDDVYSFALLMTKSPEAADDIGQDVFLSLLSNHSKLAGVSNFKGYLYTIVKFKVLSRLRHQKVEDAYRDFLSRRVDWLAISADANAQEKDLRQAIMEGIGRLPMQQRKAFELSRVHGLTHEQIGEAMGISKKTVKDYIVRAIAFLRKFLHEEGLLLLWPGLIMVS